MWVLKCDVWPARKEPILVLQLKFVLSRPIVATLMAKIILNIDRLHFFGQNFFMNTSILRYKLPKFDFFQISTFYRFFTVLCYFLNTDLLRKNETLVIYLDETTGRNIMISEIKRLQVYSSGFSVVNLSENQ